MIDDAERKNCHTLALHRWGLMATIENYVLNLIVLSKVQWGGMRVFYCRTYKVWSEYETIYSEALAVDNIWTILVVFLLGNPHSLESGERCKDGSSEPDWVFTFWRSQYLNSIVCWRQSVHFVPHSFGHTLKESWSSTEDNIGKQVLSNILVTLHHWIETVLVDTL